MKEEFVLKWVGKAENDLKTAKDELITEEPATDTICFHAQQCVDKYLKAFLVKKGKSFRKTHDIAELIEICREIDKDFASLYEMKADKLTRYAVEVRYPDDFYMPTIEEAHEACEIALTVRKFIRSKLGIE